jgi:hypothetical protein
MASTEEMAQDWNAHKLKILGDAADCKAHHTRNDQALAILPVLSNTVEEMHDRMVKLEEAIETVSDHHGGTKKRQVAALGGVGAVGLGAGQLDVVFDFLGKLFGGG